MDLISIGELSKISGVSIRALRYYHEKELLIPEFIDQESGYRYYTPSQLSRLIMLQACSTYDIPLSYIEIFEDRDHYVDFSSFILEAEQSLNKKEKELNLLRLRLNSLKENLAYFNEKKNINHPNHYSIPKRYVISRELEESVPTYLSFSTLAIELYKKIESLNLSPSYSRGLYNFKENNTLKKYAYIEIIADDYNEEQLKHISILPEGNYLCELYPLSAFKLEMKKIIEDDVNNNELIISSVLIDSNYRYDGHFIEVQKITHKKSNN